LISDEPIICFGSGKADFAVWRRVLEAKAAACKKSRLQGHLFFWPAWFGWAGETKFTA